MLYTLFSKVICYHKGDDLVDDQMLEKAVEDVQLIKNVMDRSVYSLNLAHRVFIFWGCMFAVVSAVCNLLFLLWPGLSDTLARSPFLTILPRLVVVISAFLIFFIFRKGIQVEGLNRQILLLWLAIFSFSVIFPSTSILRMWKLDLLHENMYSYFIPELPLSWIALGMFCMYVFYNIKPIGWMALSCLLLFLAADLTTGTNTLYIVKVVIFSLASPLTLLTVGILLRIKSRQKVLFTI
jgi:hypothetical protein